MFQVAYQCDPILEDLYSDTAIGGKTGLDMLLLDSTVHGLAPATLKVYKTGSKRYHLFCDLYNIHDPFPAREDILSRFVAHQYKGGLKAGKIKNYLAAVRHAQIALGLGNRHMEDMTQLE